MKRVTLGRTGLKVSRVGGILMDEPLRSAENCIQCGECEAKCPYGLPIREMTQDSLAYYRQLREARS